MKACDDVYFLTCDEYEIDGDEACNIFTFSDSRLTWLTKELDVNSQTYYLRQDLDSDTEYTADDFGEESSDSKCYPDSSPTNYKKGKFMNYTGGMCGHRFVVKNLNPTYSQTFKVLKDNATMLAAGSAFLLATALAF